MGVGRAEAEVTTPVGIGPYRRIWRIAWPVSISTSTITLLTLVNLFWIGRLGTVAVAAVSHLQPDPLHRLRHLEHRPHRRAGDRRPPRRRGRPREAFDAAAARRRVSALLLGVVVAASATRARRRASGFFGTGGPVEALAISYLRIMYLGQTTALRLRRRWAPCYQASGDARTPMLVNVAVVVANGVADPFFIFHPGELTVGGLSLGWLGWGVDGAAIAATLVRRGRLRRVPRRVALPGGALSRGRPIAASPWPPRLLQMTRIGTPASVSMIARPLSTFLLLEGDRVVRHARRSPPSASPCARSR